MKVCVFFRKLKHSTDDRFFHEHTFLHTPCQSTKEFEDETLGLWNMYQEQKGEEQAFKKTVKKKKEVF